MAVSLKRKCTIVDRVYELEFTRTARETHLYYWGTLHTPIPLEFSFKLMADKTIIFVPAGTAAFMVKAITESILN
jgi:hypothetical protein